MQLLSTHVPPQLEFFRTPIPAAPERPRAKAAAAVSEAASILSAASEPPPPKPGPVNIYGSVSTVDVATRIKDALANHPECSRVVLTAEDISFETYDGESGIEVDRVKCLGEFEINIKLKGAPETVRRTVVVHARQQEE